MLKQPQVLLLRILLLKLDHKGPYEQLPSAFYFDRKEYLTTSMRCDCAKLSFLEHQFHFINEEKAKENFPA